MSCDPPSNTLFEVNKTTTVTCTATDDDDNKAARTSDITVELQYGPLGNPGVNQIPGPSQDNQAHPRAE